MSFDFENRHVVVTGSTGELGEAVARLLLDAGAVVHLPVRRLDKAKEMYSGAGDRVQLGAVSDLGDEGAVASFYAGRPPLWASIHCAGGFAGGRADETTLAEFRRMLDMNTVPAFLCSREAVKNMRGRGGRIVNVAAQPGAEPRRGAGMSAYAASKAAVAALTLSFAEELSGESIWVNAVVPSIMDTESNRKAIPGADYAKWPKLPEVASTVAFLASPQNLVTRAALVPVYGKT